MFLEGSFFFGAGFACQVFIEYVHIETFLKFVDIYIIMVYTEKQRRGGHTYYYRSRSVREGKRFRKKRVYLGKDLTGKLLRDAERKADEAMGLYLNSLLSSEDIKALEKLKKSQKWQPTYDYEWFVTQFTYDSNAIEGSTLTLRETGLVLFDQVTPKGRSLREIHEATNHKQAFDYLLSYKEGLNRKFICYLQAILTNNTLPQEIENQRGKYRTLQVHIRGVEFIPPPPDEVPQQMKELLQWYKVNKKHLHPVVLAAYFHAIFEAIHPFIDGNGRTGRLIINYMLKQGGYPFITIPKLDRDRYYKALKSAQVKHDLKPMVKLLMKLLMSTKYRY